jgi:hypothetical protein
VKLLLAAPGIDKDAVDDNGFDAVLWAIKGKGAGNIPLLEAAGIDMNKSTVGTCGLPTHTHTLGTPNMAAASRSVPCYCGVRLCCRLCALLLPLQASG